MEEENKTKPETFCFDVWCKMCVVATDQYLLLHLLHKIVTLDEFEDVESCFADDAYNTKIHAEVLEKLKTWFHYTSCNNESSVALPGATYTKCVQHRHWILSYCTMPTTAKVDFAIVDKKYLVPTIAQKEINKEIDMK